MKVHEAKVISPSETESGQDANFVVKEGTQGCHYYNL